MYILRSAPGVVDQKTHTPSFAFPHELFRPVLAEDGVAGWDDSVVWSRFSQPRLREADDVAVLSFPVEGGGQRGQ